MKLKLEITGSGPAFDEEPATRLAELVDLVAAGIREGAFGGTIMADGTTVGSWQVAE